MSEVITPEMTLYGYQVGVFPMADPGGGIAWFSPDPRCIFSFERFHVSRSLRQTVRSGVFHVRVNTAFGRVIRACAQRREGTWISADIIRVYSELRRRGHAHSVETWRDGRLVGGLYGVAIGAAFFGESMFHRETDASKVALVALIERLRERGYTLIDTQWSTPHLASFGVITIPRAEYLERLAAAIALPRRFDAKDPSDAQHDSAS